MPGHYIENAGETDVAVVVRDEFRGERLEVKRALFLFGCARLRRRFLLNRQNPAFTGILPWGRHSWRQGGTPAAFSSNAKKPARVPACRDESRPHDRSVKAGAMFVSFQCVEHDGTKRRPSRNRRGPPT